MHLRTKITAAFTALFAAVLVADYVVEREGTYRHFEELEEQSAIRNLDRWAQAVEREVIHLSEFAGDWTDWDDAFDFVETGNPDFIEANLSSESWFENYNIPVLSFYDHDGTLKWSRRTDAPSGEALELPRLTAALSDGGRPLATGDTRRMVRGILPTSHGLLMVVSRAIYRTDGSGPAAGFAVFGRFLDDTMARTIARQTLAKGSVVSWEHFGGPGTDPALATELAASDFEPVLRRRPGMLSAYVTVQDAFGAPTIVIRSDTPTVITAQGRLALWLSVVALGGAGLIVLVAQIALVQTVIVRPLARLVEHTRRVGSTGDLTSRIGGASRDEIGELAREFDVMVVKLAESRAELVARSRATGQAEIASTVAHNLGNVLNSASVSIDAIQRELAGMRTDGPARVAGLLREHEHSLADFLANDERGRQLPHYLETFASRLEEERTALLEEAVRVQEQICHMDEILGAQRKVAKRDSYNETVSLQTTVERALAIVMPSCRRHEIDVQTHFDPLPPLRTDPVQITQVLVNLLTNAKDAITSTPNQTRRIAVSVRRRGEKVRIEVRDSGCGFEPERVEELFRVGHTTKPHGEGLGLHYCALAARRLGGSLAATSDGVGQGSLFTLELPASTADRKAAA